VASLLLACGSTEVDLGSRPQFKNGGNVVTVLAFDGVTGQPITGAAATLRVGPTILTAKAATNAYTFSNVPNGAIIMPLTVTAPNYLDFSSVQITSLAGTDPSNPTYYTYAVVMYSNAQVGPDLGTTSYTIKVYDSHLGKAVTGGQAILTMTGTSDTAVVSMIKAQAGAATNLLTGSYGFRPKTGTYPLTAGVATIPATDLVYNATYAIHIVGATSSAGDILVNKYLTSGTGNANAETLTPATTGQTKVVFLAIAGDQPIALTASNEAADANTLRALPGAQLQITFATPIEYCGAGGAGYPVDDSFHIPQIAGNTGYACFLPMGGTLGTPNGTPSKNCDTSVPTSAATANTVAVGVDSTGLILTIGTPSYSSAPVAVAATVPSIAVTYENVWVRQKGTDKPCVDAIGLGLRGASTVTTVTSTGAPAFSVVTSESVSITGDTTAWTVRIGGVVYKTGTGAVPTATTSSSQAAISGVVYIQ